MVVYGELLFIENFITGWIILKLTGKLRGYKADKWRTAAGAAMCGAYAFVLFVPLHGLVALFSKMLFSAAVVMVVFGWSTMHNLLKTAGIFYIVSFLMGGVTIGLMYMMKIPGVTGNGSFVLKGAVFVQIAAGVTATWYLGSWLAGLLHEKYVRSKVMHQVTVWISGKEWQLKGLVDTGNSLKDPITGTPVAVLSKWAAEAMSRHIDAEGFTKILMIPYKTVSGSGVMTGIRPDSMIVDGCQTAKVILGFGDKEFAPWRGCEKYDILLHQQFLEGEEQNYDQGK